MTNFVVVLPHPDLFFLCNSRSGAGSFAFRLPACGIPRRAFSTNAEKLQHGRTRFGRPYSTRLLSFRTPHRPLHLEKYHLYAYHCTFGNAYLPLHLLSGSAFAINAMIEAYFSMTSSTQTTLISIPSLSSVAGSAHVVAHCPRCLTAVYEHYGFAQISADKNVVCL